MVGSSVTSKEPMVTSKRSFEDSFSHAESLLNNFDVTMGSFDGAETCELVGCYLLSLLTDKYGQSVGLYRDDGLAAFNKTPEEIEKIKKELCKMFRENDLKTIEANKTIVNFLDVTLDLQSGKHYPCTKEGNVPLYVHKKSNHPPSIPKNIPDSINKRLSEISSDRHCFDNAKTVYQEALNKSGYNSSCLIMSHATRYSTHGRTDQETFFGTIHLSGKTSKQMQESASSLSLINTSLIHTHFTKFSTGTRFN